MREERTVAALRRVVGLTTLVAGIGSAAVQLAKGGATAPLAQTNPAAVQAAEAPRIENARLETRAAGTSLDATFRGIAAMAEKSEWVGYRVDEVAGERGVCCNKNWNDGNCGSCRLEWENSKATGTSHANANVKVEGSRQLVLPYRLEATHIVSIPVAPGSCTIDA